MGKDGPPQREQSAAADSSSLRVGRVVAPLREQVVAVLREAILDFRLQPGQRLIERELIELTGVSRTTIREVLRELTAEGLVTTIPQRGAIVVKLTKKEASDLYELRATLEALTARLFTERASGEEVASLRESFEAMRRALQASSGETPIQALIEAKDRYYEVFVSGAGNDAIRSIIAGLQARVRLMRATSLSHPGRPAQTLREIERVVAAIERRDAGAAAQAAQDHVTRAMDVGLEGLAAAEAAADGAAASAPEPSASGRATGSVKPSTSM
ncbi:MAG: GntR family transcriptional regulator [Solirubrobacteraceae bacterium]